ncbi:hypothetical protein [Streptomyces sp. NPDC058371]|uniref:hypothetical protein n=1 Tax=Streptomyces sp. NPDC058371 TaxID=3346463 RepID=UPI00365A2950
MTQSGQGEEPSARPAREGIVLPSDGGEPLLPGMTGDRATPAGGQAWGQPWGPAPSAPPAPQPGHGPDQGLDQHAGQGMDHGPAYGTGHGTGPGQGYPGYGPGQDAGHGQDQGPSGYGTGHGPGQDAGHGWGAVPDGAAAPAQNWGAPEQPPSEPAPGWGAPDGSQGWDASGGQRGWNSSGQEQSWGGVPSQPQPLPPEGAQSGSYAPGGYPAPQGPGAHAPGAQAPGSAPGAHASALPPQGPPGASAAAPGAGAGSPLPPAAPVDEGATQYIPFVPPAGSPADEGATQFLPPVPAAGQHEGATQFLPPVGPGALPPEVPADATQYLGRTQGGAGPLPPAAHPDAQATQFIAPVPAQQDAPYGIRPGGPEDRQPPAEFDNLFRTQGEGPASTQQLPRFDAQHQHQQHQQHPQSPRAAQHPQGPGGPGAPGGRAAARRGASDGGGGRTGSRVPVIVAVGVGIAVLGIGAGALLSTGSSSDTKDDTSKTVSATAPASDGSGSASADPAKEQAVALDKLLADSNDSRDSVIRSVANVKVCNNLDQAGTDLRDAAQQRGDLVTRLSGLKVDKLPDHAALTTALTSAWKASASADNHYAAWADQAAGKHGCKKGQARTTGQTQAGNRASGTASAEKAKAAKLWNSIASTYGLTQRQPTQL